MKKIILLYLTIVGLAYGYNYNDLLLKAQASMFPKIMLLDKKLDDKLIDEKIIYTVVYDKADYDTALKIRDFIDTKYNGKFDKYLYKIELVEFSQLTDKTKSSAIYVLEASDKIIKKVANIAKNKGIASFSYDMKNLEKGLFFSLMIENSTILYLNKKSLYTQKVEFVDSLLQMVKYIDKDSN